MSAIEILQESDSAPSVGTPSADGNDASAMEQTPPPTALIWAARIATLGALLFVIGYLVWCIITDVRPAQFEVEADWDALEPRNGHYVLPVKVTNDSTEAVTSVVLDIAYTDADGEDATMSATLPLMGEGESAKLEFVFKSPPREDTTEMMVTSYQSP